MNNGASKDSVAIQGVWSAAALDCTNKRFPTTSAPCMATLGEHYKIISGIAGGSGCMHGDASSFHSSPGRQNYPSPQKNVLTNPAWPELNLGLNRKPFLDTHREKDNVMLLCYSTLGACRFLEESRTSKNIPTLKRKRLHFQKSPFCHPLGLTRWLVWTGPTVASGLLHRSCPNRHICPVAQRFTI